MDDRPLHWVWQRKKPRDRSRPIGAVLEGLAGTVWFRQNRYLGRIVRALEQTLPAGLLEHLAVDGFRRNTLHLLVDSSAYRYELETMKEQLLAELNRQVSGVFIRDIRLTVSLPEDVGGPFRQARGAGRTPAE